MSGYPTFRSSAFLRVRERSCSNLREQRTAPLGSKSETEGDYETVLE